MLNKQKNIYRKTGLDFLRGALLPLIFTGAVMLIIGSGLRQAGQSSSAEGLRILEEGIRRAVVTCYAIEGRYPANLDYIETRYGIYIDTSRYVVHYDIIASNIMPEILVYEISRSE